MAIEPLMTDLAYGVIKMQNKSIVATALILGDSMIISDIPYLPDMVGIFQFPDKPEYYCALQSEVVLSLGRAETVTLRNDLEQILSNATGKEMELGFATFAQSPSNQLAVLCLFKERGVPQCLP